jgi:hypothetical protein
MECYVEISKEMGHIYLVKEILHMGLCLYWTGRKPREAIFLADEVQARERHGNSVLFFVRIAVFQLVWEQE